MRHVLPPSAARAIPALALVLLWQPVAESQPPQQGARRASRHQRSEAELKRAAGEVRAGRSLLPEDLAQRRQGGRVSELRHRQRVAADGARAAPLPSPMSETEYGAKEGMPRILAALDREKLPASFYIPAVSAMLAPEMVPAIMKSGRHEIALHGWIHESLPTLNDAAQEQRLLTQSIDYFTKVTGKRPVGYRAGAWAFSHHTMDILRKANLLYDSSLMAMDSALCAHGQRPGHRPGGAAGVVDPRRRAVLRRAPARCRPPSRSSRSTRTSSTRPTRKAGC